MVSVIPPSVLDAVAGAPSRHHDDVDVAVDAVASPAVLDALTRRGAHCAWVTGTPARYLPRSLGEAHPGGGTRRTPAGARREGGARRASSREPPDEHHVKPRDVQDRPVGTVTVARELSMIAQPIGGCLHNTAAAVRTAWMPPAPGTQAGT